MPNSSKSQPGHKSSENSHFSNPDRSYSTETPKMQEAQKPDRSVNYIIFFTGILLIIASVVLYTSFTGDKGLRLIYSLIAIGTILTLSQVPIIMTVKLASGITAGGAAAMAVMLYFFSPTSNNNPGFNDNKNDSTDAGRNLPDCSSQKISIAVFSGGNVDYTRAIKTYFLNSLQPKMNFNYNKCLYYEDYYVTPELDTAALLTQIDQTNFSNRSFDYYVAIGTSAAVGLKLYMESHQLKNQKLIFLGITNPVKSGLVNSLNDRNENSNVAGVAYCGNYENLPLKIREFYPDDTLVFVYNNNNLQDEQIALELKGIPLERQKKLIIKEFDHKDPSLADFADTNKVYFSWLTLENFFSTDKVRIIKQIKKVVSTTQTHAELGLLPLAVSTSDEEIGKTGADLIMQSLKDPKRNLGTFDVIIPKWKSYVNQTLARMNHLNPEAINKADRKF
jgi:hypothetical protein